MSDETTGPSANAAGEPSHEEISLAAYWLWDQAGRPPGRDLEHWLRAERILRAARETSRAEPG